MVPARYRKSDVHRRLWAVMRWLAEHDDSTPVLSVEKGEQPSLAVKRAASRRRDILEARAEDVVSAYMREEREHVVRAIRRGEKYDYVIRARRHALARALADVYRDAARSWRGWVRDGLKRKVERYEPVRKAEELDADVERWIRRYVGRKVVEISRTTRKQIADAVSEGMRLGEGMGKVAKRIDRLYLDEIIPHRSMVIARTEVGAAASWAAQDAAEEAADSAGVFMDKEWLSLADDRVRDDHRDASGQRVPLDEPFDVGGEPLMQPGDPSGSARNVINCRCVVLYHVVGSTEKRKAEWREEDHPRDEDGKFTSVGGGGAPGSPSDAALNDRRRLDYARQNAKWSKGDKVVYAGGSRARDLVAGAEMTVRGVWGANSDGDIVYRVSTGDGKTYAIVDRYLKPEGSEVQPGPRPEPQPEPQPKPERKPRQPKPKPDAQPVSQSRVTDAELDMLYGKPSNSAFSAEPLDVKDAAAKLMGRTGIRVDMEHVSAMDRQSARSLFRTLDRLGSDYSDVVRGVRSIPLKVEFNPPPRSLGSYDIATNTIHLTKDFVRSSLFANNLMLERSEKTGWHPPGSSKDSVMYVLSHEWGHALDATMRHEMGSKVEDWTSDETRKQLTQGVSRYATNSFFSDEYRTGGLSWWGSYAEGVAEAFSQLAMKKAGVYDGPLHPAAASLDKDIERVLRRFR